MTLKIYHYKPYSQSLASPSPRIKLHSLTLVVKYFASNHHNIRHEKLFALEEYFYIQFYDLILPPHPRLIMTYIVKAILNFEVGFIYFF